MLQQIAYFLKVSGQNAVVSGEREASTRRALESKVTPMFGYVEENSLVQTPCKSVEELKAMAKKYPSGALIRLPIDEGGCCTVIPIS